MLAVKQRSQKATGTGAFSHNNTMKQRQMKQQRRVELFLGPTTAGFAFNFTSTSEVRSVAHRTAESWSPPEKHKRQC